MQIDTSTAEGFREGMDQLGATRTRISMLLGAPEQTVRAWMNGHRPVHPTAAMMLDWMLAGHKPDNWHMTGRDLRAAREILDLTEDQLANVLDVETDTLINWESDFHGPPHFVATAVRWLVGGFRPENWPKA